MKQVMMACLILVLGFVLAVSIVLPSEAEEFSGPTKGKGLRNFSVGEIELAKEIDTLANRHMRVRYWEVAPGGVVPVHSHKNRPAFIYVANGEIYEHRSDKAEPNVYKTGDISREADGVKHWWENKSKKTVVLIAFDVYEKK
ncbi:MAG: cupin domain-containing protein [Alphaproteobacteria bacterium]|nr:cupin domain-containing protein [Alphaproteobacteria bacterium]